MSQLKALFTGDFCPQGRVNELIEQERYDLIFNNFKKEFDANDLNVVDLECPLTESGKTIHKTGPHLKANPKAVKALQYAGVHAVAMANNHINDYGAEALVETRRHCTEAGIQTVGVGRGWAEARAPLCFHIHGMNLAIINITENEWSNTYGEESGANPLDLVNNFRDIREARRHNDFVVVVYHGGNEFYELPSPRLKDTLRFFVEAGANAVIAHHTHIVSGYEVYQQAPIFYSLGNFCFDWPSQRNSFWNVGFAVRLIFSKNAPCKFEILPFRQNDAHPGIHALGSVEREQFEKNIDQLNSFISDDLVLSEKFKQYCREKKAIYEIYMEPYRNHFLASLYKRGFIPSFFSKQKKRLHLNIMRCESHRDVLLEILKQK